VHRSPFVFSTIQIRNPLNGIAGSLEQVLTAHSSTTTYLRPLLRQIQIGVQGLNPDLELWCSSGVASSKHLSSILDNVLDQSKLEAGKLKLEQLPVNLNEVCHAVTNMLR
jgi:signal transduction histidine kinase